MRRRFFPSLCLLIGVLLIGLFGCTLAPTQEVLTLKPGMGALEVQLHLPQRAVQARLSDIQRLVVTLQTPTGPQTKTVTQLANSNTSASATFTELKPCDATVSVEAFDAASQSIGVASTLVTVQAQKIVHLSLSLTIVGNQIHLGNLVADASIVDATPTPTPTPVDDSIFIINSISADRYSINNGPAEHFITFSSVRSSMTIVNNTDLDIWLAIVPMEANGQFYGPQEEYVLRHSTKPISIYVPVPRVVIMTSKYLWDYPDKWL